MRSAKKNFGISKNLPLPEFSDSRDGFRIYPREDKWLIKSISRDAFFNFDSLEELFEFKTVFAAKHVILWYLENHSLRHSENIFQNFRLFGKECNPNGVIGAEDILNFRAKLGPKQEYKLGVLVGFFKKWHELQLPGIDEDVIQLFDEIKIKGNQKGQAVLTQDPTEGPFSEIELLGIQQGINRKYANSEISSEDYLLINLMIATGSRPIQLAALKCCDLETEISDVEKIYTLKIPRAKQRHSLIRETFKEKALIHEIGVLLEAFIKRQIIRFDSDQCPIFLDSASQLSGDFNGHFTSPGLSDKINSICNSLNLYSERTGEKLKVNPRRFRYTLGTRAAEEGHGELIIAELLDHSDTQNAGVYVKATPKIVSAIDEAVAFQLAPFARAFLGRISEPESEILESERELIRISNASTDLGNCGKCGSCNALAPIACYTCAHFVAWEDAPHQEVLDKLLKQREEIEDDRIASINDRTILAVAEVIKLCSQK